MSPFDNINDKDIDRMNDLVDAGLEGEAVDEYIEKYVRPASSRFRDVVNRILRIAEAEVLPPEDMNDIAITISSQTAVYRRSLIQTFRDFIVKVFGRNVFIETDVKNPNVKKMILDNTLSLFKEKTEGALSMTNERVLSNIRKLQKDMMIGNMKIDQKVKAGEILDKEVALFKRKMREDVRKMNPDYYKMLEDGSLIRSRPFGDNESFMTYKLDQYAEMSVRSTLLNVDRVAQEVQASVKNMRVMEYYVRDPRKIKTKEREVCKHIMGTTIKGVPLVAMDDRTADMLEIMPLSRAKERGAFGVNCRHSIRPVSKALHDSIEKLFFLQETDVV